MRTIFYIDLENIDKSKIIIHNKNNEFHQTLQKNISNAIRQSQLIYQVNQSQQNYLHSQRKRQQKYQPKLFFEQQHFIKCKKCGLTIHSKTYHSYQYYKIKQRRKAYKPQAKCNQLKNIIILFPQLSIQNNINRQNQKIKLMIIKCKRCQLELGSIAKDVIQFQKDHIIQKYVNYRGFSDFKRENYEQQSLCQQQNPFKLTIKYDDDPSKFNYIEKEPLSKIKQISISSFNNVSSLKNKYLFFHQKIFYFNQNLKLTDQNQKNQQLIENRWLTLKNNELLIVSRKYQSILKNIGYFIDFMRHYYPKILKKKQQDKFSSITKKLQQDQKCLQSKFQKIYLQQRYLTQFTHGKNKDLNCIGSNNIIYDKTTMKNINK